jgi:hypothetical protein
VGSDGGKYDHHSIIINRQGHPRIPNFSRVLQGPKNGKVTIIFKFITQIMNLHTRIKLPGGNIYTHSVLSGSLLTDSMSWSC